MQKFYEKLKYNCESKHSRLCLGLDIDYNLLPNSFNKTMNGTFDFLKVVIDSTSDLCVAYKINMGFFEQFGSKGYELMEKKKVAAIPPSAFYTLDTEEGKKYIRLCFAKNDETLIKAISSLQ